MPETGQLTQLFPKIRIRPKVRFDGDFVQWTATVGATLDSGDHAGNRSGNEEQPQEGDANRDVEKHQHGNDPANDCQASRPVTGQCREDGHKTIKTDTNTV